MKHVTFAATLALFFMNANILHAGWRSEYLPLEKEYNFQVLNTPCLPQLSDQVFEYVQNSWCSKEKARLLLELVLITKPQVCVEIGPFTGSSSFPLLTGLKYLQTGKAYIVDAWSNKESIVGLPSDDPNTIWWSNLDMQAVKTQFDHMVHVWSFHSSCEILHMTSQEAISHVPLIDFLHLDGNFSTEGALQDSELYLPKVLPGGYILLSNALVMIGGKPTKMQALWPLFDECDIICELDQGNTLLFRKK